MKQIKNHILKSLNHKENYTAVAAGTNITLSNTQQAIFDANDVKYMVVYMNGLRMDESDDYTYNSSNYTLTFTEAFEGGEKITVVLSYFDDSATDLELTSLSDRYEKPFEKCKVYTTFSNTTLNLDVNNFNLFLVDTQTDNPAALTINLPNMTGNAIGKSVMLSFIFGSTLPTITWSNNIIWNTSDTLAPTFEASKSYNISLFQINNTAKYIANVNSYFTTSSYLL